MKELQHINKYFIKYKYSFLVGIFITIVTQIFSIYTLKLMSNTVNYVANFDKLSSIEKLAQSNIIYYKKAIINNIIWILITTLFAGFLTFLMRQTLIVMSRNIEYDLKNEVFAQYENLSQNFYKNNRTGDLMNRISEDVSKVRMYAGPAVMYTINTAISFTLVIYSMYHVSKTLTLYALLPLPLLTYFIFRLSQNINKRSTIFQIYLSKISSFTQEVFSGIRVVKAYSLESKYKNSLAELAEESKSKSLSLAKMNALFGPLMLALIGISNLIVIYFGGLMCINGIMEIGTIILFILYINKLTWPVASLGWVSSMVQEAEASMKRINEFLKIVPDIQNYNKEISIVSGKIEFKNVSFVYKDTNIIALKNISFVVNRGETLAIMGNTGSGKSTILTLISRMYDVTEGEILIDEQNIKEKNLFNLRNSIGNVPQDSFLFSDSIKNNIKFGISHSISKNSHHHSRYKEDDADTMNRVITAAKQAVVHQNIIDFKNGYETILGERGITLSGGQKQRISIARAIIKNPPILLFDDCLSAVDTETEEQILSNLLKISKNKTSVIVSHRVSSAKNADKIIIIENGQIIQQGTHKNLLKTMGYYRKLYYKQLSEKIIAE